MFDERKQPGFEQPLNMSKISLLVTNGVSYTDNVTCIGELSKK